MVAILMVLTIVGFLLADWISQSLAARRNEESRAPAPDEGKTVLDRAA